MNTLLLKQRGFIVTGVSVPQNVKKKLLFDDVGVTFTGEYHGTAGTDARTRFISDLFPHMNEVTDLRFVPAYTVVGRIDLCHMGGIGSL